MFAIEPSAVCVCAKKCFGCADLFSPAGETPFAPGMDIGNPVGPGCSPASLSRWTVNPAPKPGPVGSLAARPAFDSTAPPATPAACPSSTTDRVCVGVPILAPPSPSRIDAVNFVCASVGTNTAGVKSSSVVRICVDSAGLPFSSPDSISFSCLLFRPSGTALSIDATAGLFTWPAAINVAKRFASPSVAPTVFDGRNFAFPVSLSVLFALVSIAASSPGIDSALPWVSTRDVNNFTHRSVAGVSSSLESRSLVESAAVLDSPFRTSPRLARPLLPAFLAPEEFPTPVAAFGFGVTLAMSN